MIINVDVSDIVSHRMFTGIQRVVREVMPRLIAASGTHDFRLRFLRFDVVDRSFEILTETSMSAFFRSPSSDPEVAGRLEIDELGPDDMFFDLDSAWNTRSSDRLYMPASKRKARPS